MASDGLVVVDKPHGWTSHDVVARMRRVAATRKVGHAGTLDPMATGVLVLGIGKGTRLLGHLTLAEKTYTGTIRLGVATTTDDAEGEVVARADAAGVADTDIHTGVAALTGPIDQVPPQVSAIKVNGRRAYASARAGREVELKPRRVTVAEFTVTATRRGTDADHTVIDLDVDVTCSSGTYIRGLARDLGQRLGVGGHLTALRRTRSGRYGLDRARTLDQLAEHCAPLPLAEVVAAEFPTRVLDAADARRVAHGNRIPADGATDGLVGLFTPDGAVVALGEDHAGYTKPTVVFGPA